ncbi:hypothetical protein [Psychromicrobium sp. YIM B11713]|uniref:hypothetical protein n=1 Tax=Psychromicrobium sp. YIM B11713 TaxID=3145233 RepID=UPI00374EDBD4
MSVPEDRADAVSAHPAANARGRRSATNPSSRDLTSLKAVILGVAAGLLGLLPWLLSGSRLPLQNLWQLDTPPDAMPVSWLPLSQYLVIDLLSIIVTPAAIAALVLRGWKPVRRRLAIWCVALGLVAVQSTATIQSFSVLSTGIDLGLRADRISQLYFYGLLIAVLGFILAGFAVLWLMVARKVAVASLGFGLVAVPVSSWITSWFDDLLPVGILPSGVVELGRWAPAVLIGLTLAWCGFKPASRIVIWVLNLMLLWFLPGLVTALSAALGTRVLRGDVPQTLELFGQVLVAALTSAEVIAPLLLSVIIALLGALGLVLWRRRTAN